MNFINNIKTTKHAINQQMINFTNDINGLFLNANENIKKMLSTKNVVTRERKITFKDALLYNFNYTYLDGTKSSVVSELNYDSANNVNQTSFYRKESKIPLSYYEDLFAKTNNLIEKYVIDEKKPKVIAVDGTYNNTNLLNKKKLETCLNMGYYDATNQIPIHLQIKGLDKNKEIESFEKYLDDNIEDIQKCKAKIIFVFDRAYFSCDLINKLDNLGINFVIRCRNNSLYLKKNKNDKKNVKSDINLPVDNIDLPVDIPNDNNDNIDLPIDDNVDLHDDNVDLPVDNVDLTKNNIKLKKSNKLNKITNINKMRFIKYEYINNIIKKDEHDKDVKLKEKVICNLVTNLDVTYNDDDQIKELYLMRWDVEVFFKLVKYNFKFSSLDEHCSNTTERYKKKYLIIMTMLHLRKLMEYFNEKILMKDSHKKSTIKKKQLLKKINMYIMLNIIILLC